MDHAQASSAGSSEDPHVGASTSQSQVNGTSERDWSVEKVLAKISPAEQVKTTTSSGPIAFLHLIERLKTTPREGWRRFGLANAESIADHMYRMSIITMLAPRSLSSKLNIPHCTRMALVHDMAESLVGDITPIDGVSKTEKARRERATMEYLGRDVLRSHDEGAAGADLIAVWEEYEEGVTLEAQFVKDVDKLELLLQMVEYERRGNGKLDLGEFCWVQRSIKGAEMMAWSEELMRERDTFWNSVGRVPTGMDDKSASRHT